MNTETLHALCDSLFTQILEAQKREQAKWGALFQSPRTGVVTYEGGYTFNFNKGFQSEIEFQKKWLKDRAFFMDTNFLDRPIFSADGGRVQPGFSLSLSGPAGASIYYTLDGSDPRLRGGAVAAGAALYAGPILVNANARVAARSFDANHRNLTGEHNPPLSSPWSGLAAATLVVTTPPLIVSEIMYHPEASAGSSPYPQEDFEYVEVKNTGSSAYGLGGAAFVNGIEFTFPRVTLPAGERILVVRNRAAFESRYGVGRVIAGEFIGSLDNAGERLVLVGPLREPVVDFSYNNSWYPITDGYGFSLVVVNENAAFENWSQAANWRASSSLGGSPDAGDAAPPAISAIRAAAPTLAQRIATGATGRSTSRGLAASCRGGAAGDRRRTHARCGAARKSDSGRGGGRGAEFGAGAFIASVGGSAAGGRCGRVPRRAEPCRGACGGGVAAAAM